ncbi:BMP family lipoprotein [Sinosporangium siamense]|uniref:BMP family ABC transporter substrate-binding protein n=1 Tax=Sinosporangium siamense TaxID=1367973 RepID=A0A919V3F5_9ACTN|nr:BMP family ABC transporter substrate-binding protein [Sinosporangium siamense]GII90900.1 BMP family ABC transporter substrate-binding protein [Sinosporangium siamense]
MLRNRVGRLTATVLAGAMVTLGVAACGGDNSSAKPAEGGSEKPAESTGAKVGLAYDIGGRGDQSFNDSAAAGLDKAKAELKLPEAKEMTASPGETEAKKEERLRLLADQGFNPILAVGFAYSGSVKKVAAEFPDVKFAIIDDAAATGPNISNLVFAEHEGSFLVGVAAALKSKKKNIGFVGGVQVPLIEKFEAGFTAGAKAVNKDIKVQSKYLTQPPEFSGFNDPAKGKTVAEGMIDAGADVVYHAAGGSGGGVFEAAKAGDAQAIGVDADQALTADAGVKDVIMTSMLKKLDVAVFDFLKSYAGGTVKAGETVYDLKVSGVDYSVTGGKVDDIKDKLEEYKKKIISGEIKVPSTNP